MHSYHSIYLSCVFITQRVELESERIVGIQYVEANKMAISVSILSVASYCLTNCTVR